MARIDLAYTRHVQGDLPAAEALYWAMIADGEDVLSAANNLFVILSDARRSADLARLYLAVEPHLPSDPQWVDTFYARPLADGDYDAGWQWYEGRRIAYAEKARTPAFGFPEWRGEPVGALLVWPEQGRGDMIQFARYVPVLAARGIQVTLVCAPELARLFSALPARVVPLAGQVTLPAQDRWTPAGSLPLRAGPPFAPPPPPPFVAAPARSGGIGVMTAGAPTHPNDAHRSLPDALAAELLGLPGARSLRPEDTGARDFQETADLIAGLDLVITVDTAVAHLAGSLGKPVWILLSATKTDWRWGRRGTASPWYPSARLFRQPTPGDWASVLADVRSALAAGVGASG